MNDRPDPLVFRRFSPQNRRTLLRTARPLLRVPLLVSIALAIAFIGGVKSSIYALDHVPVSRR